jgi:hypothetical protein
MLHTESLAGSARQNRLLAALPEIEWERVQRNLKLVSMPLGDAVYESGAHLDHVYFPTTSIVSLLYVMAGCVGRDRGRRQRRPGGCCVVHGR